MSEFLTGYKSYGGVRKFVVKCRYEEERFNTKARNLKGKYVSPFWTFPEDMMIRVRDLLGEVFDATTSEQGTVELDVDLAEALKNRYDSFTSKGQAFLCIGPHEVIKKYGRDDTPVITGDGYLLCGSFLSSGGSVKYPDITFTEGTEIRVRVLESVGKAYAERPGYKLVPDSYKPQPERKKDKEESKEDPVREAYLRYSENRFDIVAAAEFIRLAADKLGYTGGNQ